jgi:putative ABC transport system permease protein
VSPSLLDLGTHKEALGMALSAVRGNKLRSILTLIGIVVGIFSIISVMTAMGVLRNSIEEGMTMLGANTFQVEKFDRGFNSGPGNDRFRNRKNITYEQALKVQEKATLAASVGIEIWQYGVLVWHGGEHTNPNVNLSGENIEGLETNNWVVDNGRGFTPQDIEQNARVAILGIELAGKLFRPSVNPVGATIRVDGVLYQVIGVFAKKGAALGGNQDNFLAIPLTTFFKKYGRAEDNSVNIMVKARSKELVNDCIEQVRGIMRTARKVPPGAPDDFGYFSNESLISQFNDFTRYVRLGALVISSIALLAAGIGIMNIMLVSVSERTREIGVRKAIGAQRRDILSQFIIEAIILCQLGGLVGVSLGVLGGNVVSIILKIPMIIPWDWAIIGITVCTIVGMLFGVYPAWKASVLDPIESLRYE